MRAHEPLPRPGRRPRRAARRRGRRSPLRPRRNGRGRGAAAQRRWLLSRRTRRTLRRRAPLLVAAAAVIAVAAVAALAVWAFMPSKTPNPADAKPSGPVTMTPSQIEKKYGPSVVRITATVPVVVRNRVTWRRVVSSGFVASKNGTIFASYALFYRHWGEKYWVGKTYDLVEEDYGPNWVKVEFVERRASTRRCGVSWSAGSPALAPC